MSLALIDWVLIVAYFALSLAIGLAYRKRAGSSVEEYFLSSRSLSWWMAGTFPSLSSSPRIRDRIVVDTEIDADVSNEATVSVDLPQKHPGQSRAWTR